MFEQMKQNIYSELSVRFNIGRNTYPQSQSPSLSDPERSRKCIGGNPLRVVILGRFLPITMRIWRRFEHMIHVLQLDEAYGEGAAYFVDDQTATCTA